PRMWHASRHEERGSRHAPADPLPLHAPLRTHHPGCPRRRLGGAGDRARLADPEHLIRLLERRCRVAAVQPRFARTLGAARGSISAVSVAGSVSGRHEGRLASFSQGDGVSFLPSKPFTENETVKVSATVSGRPFSWSFRVSSPYPTAQVPQFPASPATPPDSQSFTTMPGVKAPVMTVTTPDRDPAAGDVFVTNGPGPGQYGPLIYNPRGQLVWFEHLSGSETTAENLNVQSYQGQRVLTWWKGRVLSLGFGQGED